MNNNKDHTSLILADELRRLQNSENDETDDIEEVAVIQQDNITTNRTLDLVDENNPKNLQSFPIRGRGNIESLVVKAQSKDFKIKLSVDDTDVFAGQTYSYIEQLSTELPRVSAYKAKNNDYVVVINDYPFTEIVRFDVMPQQEVTFTTVRAEMFMNNIERYDSTTGIER